MEAMFGGCTSLTQLDLSSFNISNVPELEGLLVGCNKLTTIYVCQEDFDNLGEAELSSPIKFIIK